jgi:hypothetical protein
MGTAMLRRSLHEYVDHYHMERNHQGLDNRLITPMPAQTRAVERTRCRARLGGILNYYECIAA